VAGGGGGKGVRRGGGGVNAHAGRAGNQPSTDITAGEWLLSHLAGSGEGSRTPEGGGEGGFKSSVHARCSASCVLIHCNNAEPGYEGMYSGSALHSSHAHGNCGVYSVFLTVPGCVSVCPVCAASGTHTSSLTLSSSHS
jgi:hypothetical protein